MDEADYGEPIKSRRELRREREKKKRKSGILEFLVIMLVAFVLVFGLIRPFVVEAFRIPSASMVPTLEVGDRVLANKFIYRFTEPARGDVVLFDSVEEGSEDTLIKRVAGVEGDEIRVQGGTLFVNGETQDEPYLNQYIPDQSTPYGPETVPKEHVFVLGDNRGNSGDSRVFGPVPVENVKGEGFLVFWPPTHIGPV
jgi:signal peptidase I